MTRAEIPIEKHNSVLPSLRLIFRTSDIDIEHLVCLARLENLSQRTDKLLLCIQHSLSTSLTLLVSALKIDFLTSVQCVFLLNNN